MVFGFGNPKIPLVEIHGDNDGRELEIRCNEHVHGNILRAWPADGTIDPHAEIHLGLVGGARIDFCLRRLGRTVWVRGGTREHGQNPRRMHGRDDVPALWIVQAVGVEVVVVAAG